MTSKYILIQCIFFSQVNWTSWDNLKFLSHSIAICPWWALDVATQSVEGEISTEIETEKAQIYLFIRFASKDYAKTVRAKYHSSIISALIALPKQITVLCSFRIFFLSRKCAVWMVVNCLYLSNAIAKWDNVLNFIRFLFARCGEQVLSLYFKWSIFPSNRKIQKISIQFILTLRSFGCQCPLYNVL